jgi:hypothetical protein
VTRESSGLAYPACQWTDQADQRETDGADVIMSTMNLSLRDMTVGKQEETSATATTVGDLVIFYEREREHNQFATDSPCMYRERM